LDVDVSSPLLTNKLKVPEDVFGETISHLKLSLVPFTKVPFAPVAVPLLAIAPSLNVSKVKAFWFTILSALIVSIKSVPPDWSAPNEEELKVSVWFIEKLPTALSKLIDDILDELVNTNEAVTLPPESAGIADCVPELPDILKEFSPALVKFPNTPLSTPFEIAVLVADV